MFSNGLHRFKTAIFRRSRRGGEGIIEKLCQAATTKNGGIIALKMGNSLLNTCSKINEVRRMYNVGIITASDKGSRGERVDESGPAIAKIIAEHDGFNVAKCVIVADEMELLKAEMVDMCENGIDLVLTTGGTGFSKRDITPEATLAVIERRTPGIPEAMRAYSMSITPRGMLSRAEAGIRGNTLIVNMPGSPKAVKEVLEFILPSVKHGLDILLANDSECGSSGN